MCTGRLRPQAVAASQSVKSGGIMGPCPPLCGRIELPSCCSPPKFGGHHDTCEDQFGERRRHHFISWGALAQENQNTGRISQFNHINGKITLQHAPAGTVGAVGASSLVDEYKIQDGVASKDLHAGDEVDFTAAQIGGVLTIAKIQKK